MKLMWPTKRRKHAPRTSLVTFFLMGKRNETFAAKTGQGGQKWILPIGPDSRCAGRNILKPYFFTGQPEAKN
jgi:hypothetical protein